MQQQELQITKACYGLDAPSLIGEFFLFGATFLIIGLAILTYEASGHSSLPVIIGNIAISIAISMVFIGIGLLFNGCMMVWSSRYGKMHARLLDRLQLCGDETILDVGCGRGLLLLGVAKKLSAGRAVGLDLGSQEDLSHNSKSATLANAAAERVTNGVEIHDGDMRKIPFPEQHLT